jgi:hypothetical protein
MEYEEVDILRQSDIVISKIASHLLPLQQELLEYQNFVRVQKNMPELRVFDIS